MSSNNNNNSSNTNKTPRTVMGTLRGFREYMAPVPVSSAFTSKGLLTPAEFVQAGDELVFQCPAWSWETGDPANIKSYLPANKQYLVTRRVPCPTRAADLERELGLLDETTAQHLAGGGGDNDNDLDDDWLVSTLRKGGPVAKNMDDEEDDFDILDMEGEVVAPPAPPPPAAKETTANDDDDDEYADMADFEDDNVLADDDQADIVAAAATASDDNLVTVSRTYDLSITYDKYYQTPRVWMVGYHGANQTPLTGAEMLQDVMKDYANKTVTIEAHPHVAGPHASIHPCKHGAVMKTIVRNLTAAAEAKKSAPAGEGDEPGNNAGPSVEMYMFIFLKFVSSIIPGIAYDFTMDVTADTRKK